MLTSNGPNGMVAYNQFPDYYRHTLILNGKCGCYCCCCFFNTLKYCPWFVFMDTSKVQGMRMTMLSSRQRERERWPYVIIHGDTNKNVLTQINR